MHNAEERYSSDTDDVYRFLAGCVFGGSKLREVFEPHDVIRLPFMVTDSLLGSYAKRD